MPSAAHSAADLLQAVLRVQRWWRERSYAWPPYSQRGLVTLPPSANDAEEIPKAAHGGHSTWHARLQKAIRRAKESRSQSSATNCKAWLELCGEFGHFVAACRAGAVLAVHEVMLDPYGHFGKRRCGGDAESVAASSMDAAAIGLESSDLPQRVERHDPLWSVARPRFDGDRLFVHDTILLTVVGDSVGAHMDTEDAWKLHKHDLKGTQALADAIVEASCQEPFVYPVLVLVDYLGFRVVCKPQVVAVQGESEDPADFVLGTFAEAAVALGDSNMDLPELWRLAVKSDSRREQYPSLLLSRWDQHHPFLRADLGSIAKHLGTEGYVVAFESDLPNGAATTTLVRQVPKHPLPAGDAALGTVASPEGEIAELYFRTPAEVMPIEVVSESMPGNPLRRLRREALRMLSLPPLPYTERMAAGTASYFDPRWSRTRIPQMTLLEASRAAASQLPHAVLQKLGEADHPPLDSWAWTQVLHGNGMNMRHIGRVAAESGNSGAVQALCCEALARSAKRLLRQALWRRQPWAILAEGDPTDRLKKPEAIAIREALRIFNASLGSGASSYCFWEEKLVPEAARVFGLPAASLARERITCPAALFFAMQHHCCIRFLNSAAQRRFFNAEYPEPLSERDLSSFGSSTSRAFFPHLQELSKRWRSRVQSLPATHAVSYQAEFRGFYPKVQAAFPRGTQWSAACSAHDRHIREGRWNQAFEVMKLQLAFARAACDPPEVIGDLLQDMTVAMLEQAVVDSRSKNKTGGHNMHELHRAEQIDPQQLEQCLWTADTARRLLPSPMSAWSAQLVAVEAEWYRECYTACQKRAEGLRHAWELCAANQPVLRLELESRVASLYSRRGEWTSAADRLEHCCKLAEQAFGITHRATVAYYGRLGDVHARAEAWPKAAAAHQQTFVLAHSAGDQARMAHSSYELGEALRKMGDLSAAKVNAERAVKLLMPHWQGTANPEDWVGSSNCKMLALDALYSLAHINADICIRMHSLVDVDGGVTRAKLHELIAHTIRCFEALLPRAGGSVSAEPGASSRSTLIVQQVLQLKVMAMRDAERARLLDAVEMLVVTSTLPGIEELRGVWKLRPRSEARAVAEAIVQRGMERLPPGLQHLFEQLALGAFTKGSLPSTWFDNAVETMSEGFMGFPNPEDPATQATKHVLDLTRYFGNNPV